MQVKRIFTKGYNDMPASISIEYVFEVKGEPQVLINSMGHDGSGNTESPMESIFIKLTREQTAEFLSNIVNAWAEYDYELEEASDSIRRF